MSVKKSKHIFYFDALRALAILCVIFIHVFDGRTIQYVVDGYAVIPSFNWFLADFVDNCLRIGVDLFLILSGALSLGRDWTIKSFLSKRLPRIIAPFVFWTLTLSGIMIAASYFFNLTFIQSFDLNSILGFLHDAFMGARPGFYPYWFFWMILGTYLIMPIFNKWIRYASFEEIEYFLSIWLVTCLFEFTLNTEFIINLSYFTSPIGLVVLGYYLRYTERKLLNNPYFDVLLIAVPAVLMMIASYILSTPSSCYMFNRYSLPIAIEVMGVVLLFKNFNLNIGFISNPTGIFKRFVSALAKYSYGIYLTHNAVMRLADTVLSYEILHYNLYIFLIFVAALFIPLIVLASLNRIPYLNSVIGSK